MSNNYSSEMKEAISIEELTGYKSEELDMWLSGDRINNNTGEIVEPIGVYEAHPFNRKNDSLFTEAKVPNEFTSINQMERFMESVDKRKLHRMNHSKSIHDMACGEAKRKGENLIFSVSQYRTIMKLVDNLQYRNLIFGSREELSKILGVTPGNVRRTLKKVESMLKVTELKKGEYKIEISPAYGFRWFGGIQNVQKNAILNWYRPNEALERSLTSNTDYLDFIKNDFENNQSKYSIGVRQSLAFTDIERALLRKKWLEKENDFLKKQNKIWLEENMSYKDNLVAA